MSLSNGEILNMIDGAIKAVTTVSTLGDSVLVAQQFDRFIRSVQAKTIILPEARYIEMDAQISNIDRIAFAGRVLKSGTDASGDDQELAEGDFANPTPATNQLIAKDLYY